jgi:hypothetical protein
MKTGGKERKITVCANCLRACCWHGEFMCEKARPADITTRTEAELEELGLEHPDLYSDERIRKVEGRW